MDNPNTVTDNRPITMQHATIADGPDEAQQRRVMIVAGIIGLVIIVLTVVAIFWLAQPTTDTARVRDIFIIFMAILSLLIGVTLVILIIQLARLINLLNNEIKPIMESTNETVSNLRGTAVFLSDNLVQPVIKMNEYLAGLTQALSLIGLARRRPNK